MKAAGVQCVAILLMVVVLGSGIVQSEGRPFLKGSRKDLPNGFFGHDQHPEFQPHGKPGCDDNQPGGYPSPDYSSPSPVWSSPTPDYSSPSPVWSSPTPDYSSPSPVWSSPTPVDSSPSPVWSSPTPAYSSPSPVWSSPAPVYSSPAPGGY